MTNASAPSGPDLAHGVSINDLPDGRMLLGHVGEEPVLVARQGAEVFAIGATCSHYGGPLAEGLMVGDEVRCPWHHACFSLRTGAPARAPALSAVDCWSVERRGDLIRVRSKTAKPPAKRAPASAHVSGSPDRIVIVGGGAAGFAAAQQLRREGWERSLTILSDDEAPPVDRPNLSKDYLAGQAPEDWIPLKPQSFYDENEIELRLKTQVVDINVRSREVVLADGAKVAFDRLLLATGAEPVRLSIPGADLPNVRVLRSLADCRAIIELASKAQRAVVLGASFIGLEVAASLRARNIEVHVVAPEKCPMERTLGLEIGELVRVIHEEHGVIFHLEDTAAAIDGGRVVLRSGAALAADLVVAGVGVRPRAQLAQKAGLRVDKGVVVDARLETSAPGIFAAGDIARWPDARSGENIRVEHWVVAERQGQTAALNLLGRRERFDAAPFFWSQHYDAPINYLGHAETWDALEIDGDVKARNFLARYRRKGEVLAVASIFRDLDNLKEELAMERAAAGDDRKK